MIIVDELSSVPPFEQIRSQIAAQIRSGELRDGHRLPAIRQLAGDLRVAPGTVARAYSELEAAGLISTSRTAGSRVRGRKSEGSAPSQLDLAVLNLIEHAQAAGLSQADAVGLVQSAWLKRSGPAAGGRGAELGES